MIDLKPLQRLQRTPPDTAVRRDPGTGEPYLVCTRCGLEVFRRENFQCSMCPPSGRGH